MCKFCDLPVGKMKSIASRNSVRPISILHETPRRWRLVSSQNKHRLMESVPIHRCPKCGRDLNEFNVCEAVKVFEDFLSR